MYASKGPIVEEWADRRFFRPVGWRIATALQPTRISADAVTLASLVLGVLAGHLFWYRGAWINAAGVLLFIVSDVLDSADGQLARLRGTSTRMGRILDGLADTGRFVSLYGHLGARLYVAHGWNGAVLALAALLSHSYQAAAADFIRQAYLYFAVGSGSELDIAEQSPTPESASLWSRISAWLYGDYVRRQAWLFPQTTALARGLAGRDVPASLRRSWAQRQRWVVQACALIAQNIRWLLLALTVVPHWPSAYCWIVVGPLNLVLVFLILSHEREPKFHAQLA
ncbi:MAG TPA: CDP-alcohol phosphatidyltransferase family protein [Gemmatimonadales bacterium]|nr:CDP-alcohol phosphatidyltransferase family protein [Gemmatimonadales bacterium]